MSQGKRRKPRTVYTYESKLFDAPLGFEPKLQKVNLFFFFYCYF